MIDTRTGAVVGSPVEVPGSFALAISPKGDRLYAASDDTIGVIETDGPLRATTFDLGIE